MNLSSKNIVAVIALIVLLVYGGLKGLIYYKFKNAVDSTSAQMRIFATLRYETISSSLLDNSVTIHKVSILPSGFEDSINIDAITLQTQSLGYLLGGLSSSRGSGRGGEFPERLNITMNGLKIDLYGSMVDKLEQALAQLSSVIPDTVQTACGNKLYLGPAEYRDMGYDILDSNLRFAYTFSTDGINVAMDWSTKDMASATLEMKMSSPSHASTMALISSPPQLQELAISYHDLSYTQRSNEYCAKQGKYNNVAEYITATSNQGDAAYALQWGFVPGPGIKQAYKDFLANPGNIKVSIRPPKGFNQNTIGLYKAEDLVSVLNLEIIVNDKPITDLSFAFTPAESTSDAGAVVSIQERLENFKALLEQKEIKPAEKAKLKAKGPTPRFHTVKMSQLKPLIGKQTRVYTKNNQIRRGTLTGLSAKTLNVTQLVHRGEFTMNIDKTNVKKIEVFYAK